ncbi:MAG: LysM peptidoglycan-binding domain-containing protein [Firmicutes bacterium]|nr:LysM peptidoglycan-binding domain-containing protein [Bacillota bacterium]
MNKKYRITSKFRFTMFLVVMILCLMTVVGTLLGLNTVNSASLNQYNHVQVEAGDTIWNIACEYAPDNMDVRKVVHDICDVNGISADELAAGSKIIVPVYQ